MNTPRMYNIYKYYVTYVMWKWVSPHDQEQFRFEWFTVHLGTMAVKYHKHSYLI